MLHVYTGNGKGKTTAAIGLAIRAAGADLRIYFAQFMKSLAYSEQKILQAMPQIVLQTTGKPFFIAEEGTIDKETIAKFDTDVVIFPKGNPPADYIELIEQGLQKLETALDNQHYDIIVLDEVNVALFFGLIKKEQVEHLLNLIPADSEIICTGRNAPGWLIDRADLVTEMKLIKHYFDKGLMGRKGIED